MRYFPRDFAFGTLCLRDFLMWRDEPRLRGPSLFRNPVNGYRRQGRFAGAIARGHRDGGLLLHAGVTSVAGEDVCGGEDQPTAGSLAVISESFGGGASPQDPVCWGKLLVNGDAFDCDRRDARQLRVSAAHTEVWTNLLLKPPERYGPWFYRGMARLKPGVTLQQAQAETNDIGLRMMQQNPDYKRLTLPTVALREALLGPTLKPAILVLAVAVGLVLLIAVVNVANLMLARSTVREREMAMRLSLGAGRGRLVRQLLTESVLLAVMGGTAGLAVARGGIEMIRVWNPGNLPFISSVRLDGGALAFMLLVSMVTGILFGLAPAFESARADLNSTIKEGGRGSSSSKARGRTRAALVIAEIAVSLTLLVSAALLLRSFANLQRVTGGFSTPPRQILTMLISPGSAKYKDARAGVAFYDEVLRRARNVPGVEIAAVTDTLPPDRQGDADTFGMEGQALSRGEMNPIVSSATAGPDYFRVLGIPLLRGRYFTEHDNQDIEARSDCQRRLCTAVLSKPGGPRQAHPAERARDGQPVARDCRRGRQCEIPRIDGGYGSRLLHAVRTDVWSANVPGCALITGMLRS